jgi:CRISPR-associated endonuclease Csn1
MPKTRNPVVKKALFELRKLMNAIIRRYGKPDIVRVELAREIALSKKQKEEEAKKQRLNREENEKVREILQQEFNIENPTKDDIVKYRLWKECEMICPYTGKPISREMLFSPEVDIEHIIPYSRCLDNSFMNKTLCLADENRRVKHNKTPYEAYHIDSDRYAAIKLRVKNFPWKKRKKFELQEINTEELVTRQLNDTRYISREIKSYLEKHGLTVEPTKGIITAALRKIWMLNKVLNSTNEEKNRNDHRHHAIDAIVIALTSRKLFKLITEIAKKTDKVLGESNFSLGNHGLLSEQDVNHKIQSIIVCHAPTRKLSGALHKETAYGYSKAEDCFVYRKPLDSISNKEIEKIRDSKVKELVKKRVEQFNGDLKKAFGNLENNPLLHVDGKTKIKSVRVKLERLSNVLSVKNQDGNPYKYYKLGNNHHVEIIENIKTGERKGVFVTTLETAQRVRKEKTALINKDHEAGWRFVMSLAANEMVEVIDEDGNKQYYRVQKISNPTITLRLHTSTSTSDSDQRPEVLRCTANTLSGRKVVVDYFSNVIPAND